MGRAYYRLFVSFLVIIIVPVVAFGIFAYNSSVLSMEKEAIKSSQTLLNIYKEKIDGMLGEIDTSFIQNGLVIETFDGITLPSSLGNYLAQKKLMNINEFAMHLTAGNSIIDDAMIYYKQDRVFVTPDGRFVEKGFKDEVVAYQLRDNNANVLWLGPRWIKSKRSRRTIPVMSYIRQLPLLSAYKKAAFVVDIDLYSLSSMMTHYGNNYEGQKLYLLDSKGVVIADADKQLIGKDLSVYPYISQILGQKEGYKFRDDIDGQTSLISFSPSSIPGWKYVVITPMQSLMAGSIAIRHGIVVMTVFLIIVGIAASFVISRRLYKPVKSIVTSWQGVKPIDRHADEYAVISDYLATLQQRNNNLEQRWKDAWPVVKEKMLLDMLKGRNAMINNMIDNLQLYGIKTELNNFVVLATEIDDIEHMGDIDKELFLFSVKNAVTEIINAEYDGFVTSEDYTVLSAVNLPQAEYYLDYKRTVRYLCSEIMDSIKKYMGFTISIGVSRLYHKPDELCKAYSEAMEAIKYRLVYGKHSVAFIEDAEPASEGTSVYPYDKEKELVMYIKAMDMEKTIVVLGDIIAYLDGCKSYDYLRQFFIQLVGYIMISIYDMGYTESDIFGQRSLYGELNNLKTLEDIRQWLGHLCQAIIAFLECRHKEQSKDIVIQCRDYIDQHFDDPELSLSAVAEKLYTSDSYLSRMFKEQTGMTFTEYLTLKRIEKAKYLLKCTDMTMNQIAENIGLSLQSFMRIFKKHESISPGQFRAAKRP